MADCIFCKIAQGEIPSKKVWEDDDILAFHDLEPQAPVHVLIVPKRHLSTLNDLAESDRDLMGNLWTRVPRIAEKLGIGGDGYRVVANCLAPAGQSVFHIHFHVLGGRPMGWPPG